MRRLERLIADYDSVICGRGSEYGSARYGELYHVLRQLGRSLFAGAKVLEYGAWAGLYCVYINDLYGAEVWAIDNWQFAKAMGRNPDDWLQLVNSYGKQGVHAGYGDVCRMEFPDSFFDAVYSLGVHEHIEKDWLALCEIERVMKPNAVCSMTVDFAEKGWQYVDIPPGRCYDRRSLEQLIASSPLEYVDRPDYASIERTTKNNTQASPCLQPIAVLLRKRVK